MWKWLAWVSINKAARRHVWNRHLNYFTQRNSAKICPSPGLGQCVYQVYTDGTYRQWQARIHGCNWRICWSKQLWNVSKSLKGTIQTNKSVELAAISEENLKIYSLNDGGYNIYTDSAYGLNFVKRGVYSTWTGKGMDGPTAGVYMLQTKTWSSPFWRWEEEMLSRCLHPEGGS